jgi:hypothetical protein
MKQKEKLIEQLEKLSGKKVVLKEGTWAFDKKSAVELSLALSALQEKYFSLVGDDQVWDGVDSALARIKELNKL